MDIVHLPYPTHKEAEFGKLASFHQTMIRPVHAKVSLPHTAPVISIVIIPVSEQGSYNLTCIVSGYENLTHTVTYKWTKNNGSHQTQVGTDSSTLSFSPLKPSDCGQYTCKATISSHYLSKDITFSTSHDIVFQCELYTLVHIAQLLAMYTPSHSSNPIVTNDCQQ